MTVATVESPATPSPQRLVLVLPTDARFDSRTYRIASTLAGRGHGVTVLARAGRNLPVDDEHPAGYRIVRVPVSAIDGLPLPAFARRVVAAAWRRRRPSTNNGGTPASDIGGADATRADVTGADVRDAAWVLGAGPTSAPAGPGPAGAAVLVVRRAIAGAVRMTAIFLTVRSQARTLRRVDPGADLYHAMGYMGIPVALDLARRNTGARVIYDARDIYVDANNLARLPGPVRVLLGQFERGWARRADRVITVNRPYAEVMAARWHVPLPAIVLNCAYRRRPAGPAPRRFHERLGLAPSTRVVLYQGGWSPHRGIEQLLEAIVLVDDAVLVLLGYGVLARDLEVAVKRPDLEVRVHLLPAVPPEELLDWVAAADVVAMPIQPSTLNHHLTTPNKLFEAMAAGVPVVASDLPGMSGIVRDTGCGLVCDPTDPGAIAEAIRAIIDAPEPERAGYSERALAAADSTYNWEAQAEVLLDEYFRLTGRRW
jgi:glycosyltransferase involved in cell wall biosynthesis